MRRGMGPGNPRTGAVDAFEEPLTYLCQIWYQRVATGEIVEVETRLLCGPGYWRRRELVSYCLVKNGGYLNSCPGHPEKLRELYCKGGIREEHWPSITTGEAIGPGRLTHAIALYEVLWFKDRNHAEPQLHFSRYD